MADGAVIIGSYSPYPFTTDGAVVVGSYSPYPFTVDGAVIIGTYGLGALPNYNPSLVIAVARVQQGLAFPQFVMGGQGGASATSYQLFKKSTSSYGFTLWRSKKYLIGTDFDILQITIPLVGAVAAGASIIPKLYFDDGSVTSVGNEINSTTYPNSERLIILTSKNFDVTHGKSNFFLELQITSTILTAIGLPIHIEIDEQV